MARFPFAARARVLLRARKRTNTPSFSFLLLHQLAFPAPPFLSLFSLPSPLLFLLRPSPSLRPSLSPFTVSLFLLPSASSSSDERGSLLTSIPAACDIPSYLLLLYLAQEPDLLEAETCDVPYYYFTLPRDQTCWRLGLVMYLITKVPRGHFCWRLGLMMHTVTTLPCPVDRLAGGWAL